MMALKLRYFLLTAILCLPLSSVAKVESYTFETEKQEATYKKIIAELRCLVCQNQNLADSNAELAQDMRAKAYSMVSEGKTDKEISEFMVARYGDFVLYRPPLKATTFFLWFGPAVLLIIAAIIIAVFLRKQKQPEAVVEETAQQRAHSVLDDD